MAIGKIVNAQGIKGKLKVISYGSSTESFLSHLSRKEIYLNGEGGDFIRYKLTAFQPHKNIFFITLGNICSRDDAGKLVGCNIYIPKKNLPGLPSGEYYWFEIIGLNVFTRQGKYLGKIKEILSTGSNDVYVARNEGAEHLIPAIPDVVTKIDVDKNMMVIQPLEGLLEDNEN